MPGIAGIIDGNGTGLTSSMAKMLGCLKSEDWHVKDSYAEPGFAIGNVNLGGQKPAPLPVFNSDRTVSLCMTGEIYHYPPALAKPGHLPDGRGPDSDAQRALYLIERHGIEVVSQLNGAFALSLWDSVKKTLLVANDRFGLKPVYYFHKNNFFAFASEIKALLALPESDREIDLQAVAEFLSLEFALGNKTFFKNIKALAAASILTVRGPNLQVKAYWTPGGPPGESPIHKEEPLERAKFLLCQALKRHVRDNEKVTLSLSGGLDSRLILAAAVEAGRPISTFTFGQKGSPDAIIAAALAESFGVKNVLFELSPDYLARWARHGVWRTDGMNNCINFAGIDILPEVGKRTRRVLNGYGGNEFWGGISPGLVKFLFIQDAEFLTRAFFEKLNTAFGEAAQPELFLPGFYDKIKGTVYDSFREVFDRFTHTSSLGRLYRFWLEEKNRKCSLMGLVLDGDQVEYRAPFFDYNLADFLLSVPPG